MTLKRPAHLLPEAARDPHSTLRGRGVTAVLGPTNTGKTHLAIERMLGHESGLIGLPLRLLAREVYTRLVEKVGAAPVALITGEEKILPPNARYWVSTVEAMPRDLAVSFVAIDEVQLISDAERGHVFTDAVLHRRGRGETLLLGAATARGLLERLLPGLEIQTRPRLSRLVFAGEMKLSRLPPRSAIIAFSTEEVYAIAELVRRQKGGAAIVMGQLSPRARNAQVAMFQAGEVDHLVATDAIGMGLNLAISHVAFASLRKFDGQRYRGLHPSEIAQIAGRAGRAFEDGTFGTTGTCPAFSPEQVESLENHRFDPLSVAQWRHSALDFSTPERLVQTLNRAPGQPELTRVRQNEDEETLNILLARPGIRALADSETRIKLLWDVCQLPDYRKVSPHLHADLAGQIYENIVRKGSIDEIWFAREAKRAERLEGDLDSLTFRLAQIRTLAYCANRAEWMAHAMHWQIAMRALEDKLSDALHEKLTERFVARRSSVLMRRLKENVMLATEIKPTGEVVVEGQTIGRIEGFRFSPDPAAGAEEARTLRAAATKALEGEMELRATRLSTAPDTQLTLSLDGLLRYQGEPVAVLQAGADILEPRLLLLADDGLSPMHRDMAEMRLAIWLKAHINRLLGPLFLLKSGEGLEGLARGIAFRLAEGLGVIDRSDVASDMKTLPQEGRAALRKLGVRFGALSIFIPLLLKPGARSLATQLYALQKSNESQALDPQSLKDVAHLAFSGRTSIAHDPAIAADFYRIAGFRIAGPRAVRVDILERLADLIRAAISYRPGESIGNVPPGAADGDSFVITGDMTSIVGCAGAEFADVLRAMGYRSQTRKGPAITVALKTAPVAATAPIAGPQDLAAATPAGPDNGVEAPPETTPPEVQQIAPAEAAAMEQTLPVSAEPGTGEHPSGDTPAPPVLAAETPAVQTPEASEIETSEIPETEALPPAVSEEVTDLSAVPEGASEAQTATAAPDAGEAPAEPAEIEIWRVARPDRPKRDYTREGAKPREGHRGPRAEAPNAEGQKREGAPPSNRERKPFFRKPEGVPRPAMAQAGEGVAPNNRATPAGENAPAKQPSPKRAGAPGGAFGKTGAPGGGFGGGFGKSGGGSEGRGEGGRREKPRDFNKRDAKGGGKGEDRRLFASSGPEKTSSGPDPDSPFAKLLALKAQMEGKT